MNKPADHNIKGIAFIFSVTFVGSSASAASKWISAEIEVAVIVFIQYIICMLVMLPWCCKQYLAKGWRGFYSPQWVNHLIRGIAGWFGFYCFYEALHLTPLVDHHAVKKYRAFTGPLRSLVMVTRSRTFRSMDSQHPGFSGYCLNPATRIGWNQYRSCFWPYLGYGAGGIHGGHAYFIPHR